MKKLAALSFLIVLLVAATVYADRCPNCNGTGRYCYTAYRPARGGGIEAYQKCDICQVCMGSGHIAGQHHQQDAPQFYVPPPGAANRACFVATAVYGNPDHEHVVILREFRDRWLLTNKPGRRFAALYYRYGPRVAEVVGEHEALRQVARVVLLPVVGFSHFMNRL